MVKSDRHTGEKDFFFFLNLAHTYNNIPEKLCTSIKKSEINCRGYVFSSCLHQAEVLIPVVDLVCSLTRLDFQSSGKVSLSCKRSSCSISFFVVFSDLAYVSQIRLPEIMQLPLSRPRILYHFLPLAIYPSN